MGDRLAPELTDIQSEIQRMDNDPAPELAAATTTGRRGYVIRALRGMGRHARPPNEHQRIFELLNLSSWEWNIRTGELISSLNPASTVSPAEPYRGTLDGFAESVHPDDRPHYREAFRRAAAEETGFTIEFRLLLPDGQIRWRRVVGSVTRDRKGRVTHLVGTGQDIALRKEAEERLQLAEQHYRTLVEQLPLATYVEQLGTESATYISPQIADLGGYTAEEWMADPDFFGRVLHPEDRDRVLTGVAAMKASGRAFECEYRLIARDGHEVWVRDAAVVVHDEGGDGSYVQGYMIDVTDRKRAELALQASQELLRAHDAEMEHQALHDTLTGLPNRTLFHDRAERELLHANREGTRFAVMVIDLDRFKEVNDTHGHHTGDALLREVAQRLRRALRRSDTVARLGGDEFAVVAPRLSGAAVATGLADKLRTTLLEPFVVGGLTIEIEASVGIALFPDHGEDIETLTRFADVSMYMSKKTHGPVVYDHAYEQDSPPGLELVSKPNTALA
jgi:diguanylate cyclase (GGDEF)-like protein/PAS domain S-box-containing protein